MAEVGDSPGPTILPAGKDRGLDLLIGLGNGLRGDDGVGPDLAAWAAGRWPQLRVCSVHQLTPELSSDLAQARRVLFIDACCVPPAAAAAANGCHEPVLLPLGAFAAEAGAFSHHLDPQQLLAITLLLHGRAPQGWQLLVPAFRCGHGAGLSHELQALLPRARGLLRSWCEATVAAASGVQTHA